MSDMNKFKDITPAKHKCTMMASCPSIAISEDGKTYRIRGKLIATVGSNFEFPSYSGRSFDLEAEIDISASLLEDALKKKQNG